MTDPAEIRAEGRRLVEDWRSLRLQSESFASWVEKHADVLLADPAPVDDRERVPEPWVTYGPTGRRYRLNVDLLSDGDRMPEWLTADPVSPSVDPEEGP